MSDSEYQAISRLESDASDSDTAGMAELWRSLKQRMERVGLNPHQVHKRSKVNYESVLGFFRGQNVNTRTAQRIQSVIDEEEHRQEDSRRLTPGTGPAEVGDTRTTLQEVEMNDPQRRMIHLIEGLPRDVADDQMVDELWDFLTEARQRRRTATRGSTGSG